jgi:NitT/TauT family transport system substrate-binding protein
MRKRDLRWAGLIAAALALLAPAAAHAEAGEIRVGRQPGLTYLPLMMMEHDKLLEKHARAQGLAGLAYRTISLASAAALNDGLLSDQVDCVAGAITVMAVLADKTGATMNVRGIAALNSGSMYLNTNNPAVKTVRDFGDNDRIAVSAVKLSIHAVLLQMAAAQAFGPAEYERLDRLTVSLPHPDGMAALVGGRTEVTAHFTTPPFQFIELEKPGIHKVTGTKEILGGPGNISLVWTTGKFRDANPRAYKAFLAALEEATQAIAADRTRAAAIYKEMDKSTMPLDFVEKLLADPDNVYTTTPERVMPYIEFLKRTGRLKRDYASWKDLFFPEIYEKQGS